MKKKIIRNSAGIITRACLKDMEASLPVRMWVNDSVAPGGLIRTKEELDAYLVPAIPYCLTTHYEHYD